jgi:hypothetical protein
MPRRLTSLLAPLAVAALPGLLAAQQSAPADTALLRVLREMRLPARAAACALEGPGGEAIVAAARGAQFTVLGEAHGVNDVPRFAAALYCDLARAGYRHLAIEVSPPAAAELDRRARAREPMRALEAFGEEHFPGAPFYLLREEAQLLADAVRASGGAPNVLWGIDYDVMPEGLVLPRLAELAAPGARALVDSLVRTARRMYAAALAQKNPGRVFSFEGADSLTAAVRAAVRPARGSEADRLLSLVENTRRINAEWLSGRGYESNLRRSENLRANFLEHYRATARGGSKPKVMVKLGASHSYRGLSLVNTFDVGSLVPELAALEGTSSVGILLIAGAGAQQALFDVRTFSYAPAPSVYGTTAWTRPFYAAADSAAWTVFDLRRLREAVNAGSLGPLSPSTTQAVFGFDFLVILGGSAPSRPFELTKPAWATLP